MTMVHHNFRRRSTSSSSSAAAAAAAAAAEAEERNGGSPVGEIDEKKFKLELNSGNENPGYNTIGTSSFRVASSRN